MKGRQRGVRPYRTRIIELRREKRWTQEELAGQANLDPRQVGRLEQGKQGKRASPGTLQKVARALNVEYYEIVLPDLLPGTKTQHWLDEVEKADLHGDYPNARRIAEAVVARLSPKDTLYEEACVRLAIVCDHQQQWERARDVFDERLKVGQDGGKAPGHSWVLYQRGVIQRTYAEHLLSRTRWTKTPAICKLLEAAERDLKAVKASGDPDLIVAAKHQLGVLKLLRGNYEEAQRVFENCLKLRQEGRGASAAPYRLAYEYRRLGQCYAHQAKREEAKKHFDRAVGLAEESAHERLRLDLLRDMQAWGLEDG